jgi:hypothetical protein
MNQISWLRLCTVAGKGFQVALEGDRAHDDRQ